MCAIKIRHRPSLPKMLCSMRIVDCGSSWVRMPSLAAYGRGSPKRSNRRAQSLSPAMPSGTRMFWNMIACDAAPRPAQQPEQPCPLGGRIEGGLANCCHAMVVIAPASCTAPADTAPGAVTIAACAAD